MKKKVLITLSIATFLAIGIKTFLPNVEEKDALVKIEIEDVDAFFALPVDKDNLTQLVSLNKEQKSTTKDDQLLTKVEKVKVQKVANIYHQIDKEELLKEMPHKQRVEPLLGIQIVENSISKLAVGDVIKLPAVGQIEYQVSISKKITHKNGSTSVTGNLVGDQNSKHAVILTEGKSTSYASINTPEGAFEIETINGVGYVYSVQDIENEYINPDKEDILHPVEHKHLS